MIAPLPLWRLMAWIGVMWRGLNDGNKERVVRWRDKTPAVGWGVCGWGSWENCADTKVALLAIFAENHAIPRRKAPSPRFQTAP